VTVHPAVELLLASGDDAVEAGIGYAAIKSP